MKHLSVFISLSFGISAYSQIPDRAFLLKHRIKSMTQKADSAIETVYSEFNLKGLIVKQITKPHFFYPNSEQVTQYNYIKDTLLSTEITTIFPENSSPISDTTFYEYDKFDRLEFIYCPNTEHSSGLLTQYTYVQGWRGEVSKKIWQKKIYWLDSTKRDNKNQCSFIFRDSKKYYLREYEMYNYGADPNVPSGIYYFYKCNSGQDKTTQTFCLSQTQVTMNFGDTLIQYLTLNVNLHDYVLKEREHTCDSVDLPGWTPGFDKIVIQKFKNSKNTETIFEEGGQFPYSGSIRYFYNDKEELIKMARKFIYRTIGKQVAESTFTYSYEYYK